MARDKTPLTKIEQSIAAKLSRASFPPATASKRIVRDLSSGHVKHLSPRGREFLAFVAHRFRRQWQATPKEWQWVLGHLAAPAVAQARRSPPEKRPTQRSEKVPLEYAMPRAEFPDVHKWIGDAVVHSGHGDPAVTQFPNSRPAKARRKELALRHCAPAQLSLF